MALTVERFRGCLLGLAAGDALGATVQFIAPGNFEPIEDIVGGGSFSLKPGEWTDDTSMALCLAESLIDRRGFYPLDQMERYLRWFRHGYMSCKRYAFDIGAATRAALERFERTREPFCGIDPQSAGNGSLMRLAPVAMAFASMPEAAIQNAGISSTTTHGAVDAADACRYFAGLLVGALNGVNKKELLSDSYCPIHGYWKHNPLAGSIAEIAQGSYKRKQPPKIINDGWVVKTLEAALWGFYNTAS
ncbi:MAG: ADP-ribosylglycohydrolase family protein, partial [Omnitrophica WOR_2 bacterium]